MRDQTATSIEQIRIALSGIVKAGSGDPQEKSEARRLLRSLKTPHNRCIDVSAANAAIHFFSEGANSGLSLLDAIYKNKHEYYTARFLSSLSIPRLRSLVPEVAAISSSDYIRFLFGFYYLREEYTADGFLFSWIQDEWAKRKRKKQYDELYLLRNLCWSAISHVPLHTYSEAFKKWIGLMDVDILAILRARISGEPRTRRGRPQTIAICCGVLKTSYRFVHARLVLDYARNLARCAPDLVVHIIVTNEIPFTWVGHSYWMKAVEKTYIDDIWSMAHNIVGGALGDTVKLTYLPLASYDHQDLLSAINAVDKIDADVLMFYGSKFHNESWFVRKCLFARYPVVYFFTQMINRVDRQNDIYLARNNEPLRGSYDPARVRVAPPAMRLDIVVEGETRGNSRPHRVTSSATPRTPEVTIVTLMAGTRLETILRGYDPAVREQMMALLEEPRAKWIWVGATKPAAVLAVDPLFRQFEKAGRLEVRKFEPDIIALLQRCDLMLHLPKFTGGAGGISLALRLGIPVLCFSDTDAAVYVTPQCVYAKNDLNAYFARATQLIRNPAKLPELGAKAHDFYSAYDPRAAAKLTIDGLSDAMTSFNSRMTERRQNHANVT